MSVTGIVTTDKSVDIITNFAGYLVSSPHLLENIITLFALGIAENATKFSLMSEISIKLAKINIKSAHIAGQIISLIIAEAYTLPSRKSSFKEVSAIFMPSKVMASGPTISANKLTIF